MRRVRLVTVVVLACASLATAGPARAATTYTADQLYGGAVPADVAQVSAAAGHSWRPDPARYGIGSELDVPVRMSDGTVLRANVYYPTTGGAAAAGPFPVLLTQTPYGKGNSATTSQANPVTGNATGGANPDWIRRGYIEVVADVRGTGDSEGSWGLFDPIQSQDGVTLVDWAAALPHSTHTVGLFGPSYLGINQLFTAASMPKNSPLKAIFPVVPANDIYRDTVAMGGVIDAEFDATYLGALTAALNATNPVVEGPANPDAATVIAQHAADIATYNEAFIARTELGGPDAYDDPYWAERAPGAVLSRIVANGIPAYLVGGEYDIFQRGEPLDFAALQNLWAGRPSTAPMSPLQSVTGRYQLLDGPWTHTIGAGPQISDLQLEWFDTWLKHEDTGMASTPTPLHYFDLGTNRYVETARYPFTDVRPTRYYFGAGRTGTAPSTNDGTLSTVRPSSSGSDTMVWLPTGSPCGRSTDQWSLGVLSNVERAAALPAQPCVSDDSTTALGPGSLTYTTAPLPTARTLAGPIAATVYATATTRETEWVAEIEDVAPDRTSRPLTEGALLGSLRAVDASRSWRAPDGQYTMPYHPYTQASAQPVTPGTVTRYDLEIFPTYATIAAGHRIRVTLASSDAPHLVPTPAQATQLAGGVYQVQRSPDAASALELPLSTPGATVRPVPAPGGSAAKPSAVPTGVPAGLGAPAGGTDGPWLVATLLALLLAAAGIGVATRRR